MTIRAAHDAPPVGACVEYLGEDLPELYLWKGHPGVVIDAPAFEPRELVVAFVAGPSLCVPAAEVQGLDDAKYRSRGRRIIDGTHPIADREVGPLLTAEGSNWP